MATDTSSRSYASLLIERGVSVGADAYRRTMTEAGTTVIGGGAVNLREFAKAFYHSAAWKETRKAYAKSVGGLCERCLRKGIYTAGEIVHHKVALTPENITDPRISLDWNNLELVCRQCHGEAHRSGDFRYKFDEFGRVVYPPSTI